MKIITNGRNIELTDAIKDYVSEKLVRIANHYVIVNEVHIILGVEKNPRIHDKHLAEATVHVPGAVMRLEVASENLYASIDVLIDKIDRSLRKHKTKLQSHGGSHDHSATIRRHADGTEMDGSETATALADDEEDTDVEITYVVEN